jgi:superfamily II DNA or RNA helicase
MTHVRGGILTLGCGYGKTVLACYYMAHEGLKAAVLVDKVNLISQWAEEITKHLNVPAHRVGVVQGKKWEWEDHDIVLISIRTLSTRGDDIPDGFYESFGVAVFDECHHLAAPTFKRVVPRFPGIRIGLSATPKREDGLDIIFRNHLGDVFYEKTDQELIPRIIFHDTGLENSVAEQPDALDRTGEIHYRRLCECLGREELRTELGIEYVKKLRSAGHHILCLSASVQNVLDFAARTSEALGETVGIACGDTKGDQRAKEITNNRVAVGTLDIASEALNVPSLSALLILSPFGAPKYGNTLKQTLGRIQRVTNKKPDPVCIILSDDGIGMCRGLINQLKRALRKMEYPYEVKKRGAACHL